MVPTGYGLVVKKRGRRSSVGRSGGRHVTAGSDDWGESALLLVRRFRFDGGWAGLVVVVVVAGVVEAEMVVTRLSCNGYGVEYSGGWRARKHAG